MDDFKSIFWPNSSVAASPLPVVGNPAPPLFKESDNPLKLSNAVVLFVRHCGCPFAQNEVMSVAALCNSNPSLSAVVVSMGSEKEAVEWFERIGGNEFQDKSRVVLISDYNRVQYAAWGLQLLSYSQLFSMPMMTALLALKKKGVVNTQTGEGSNRWQNSGGFAVNSANEITFVKVAVHAGDMVDYEAAVRSLNL